MLKLGHSNHPFTAYLFRNFDLLINLGGKREIQREFTLMEIVDVWNVSNSSFAILIFLIYQIVVGCPLFSSYICTSIFKFPNFPSASVNYELVVWICLFIFLP